MPDYATYLFLMGGITYLIRALPLILVKKKIKNKFILSFLYYIPYAVLSVMTFPAIFYSTASTLSAIVGTIIALLLAYFEKSLIVVALASSLGVFIVEFLTRIL